MPVHSYRCPVDGIERDAYRPITERATTHPPTCPDCTATMEWLPRLGAVDAFDQRAFTTTVPTADGGFREVRVGSLRDMRRIEADTARAAANGEGAAMRWRDWSNDRSNRDVNSFGPNPNQSPHRYTRRGEKITVRRGDVVGRDHSD